MHNPPTPNPIHLTRPPSASGLGRATAQHLHSLGASIAILDMNEDDGEEFVRALGEQGEGRAKFFAVDVAGSESIAKAVEGVVGWMGTTGRELGGVVAAAGVGNPGKVSLGFFWCMLTCVCVCVCVRVWVRAELWRRFVEFVESALWVLTDDDVRVWIDYRSLWRAAIS